MYRLDLGLYSHPKEFWGNGVRTHIILTPREKSPLLEKKSPQRKIEPRTLHQAGQSAQHTLNELFQPHPSPTSDLNIGPLTADQTTDHVLQSCPTYAEKRQLTWRLGADLATRLDRRPLPVGWFCGINWAEGLRC